MADSDTDKTEEIRERLGDDDTVGADTDSDSGAVLTLDSDSDSSDDTGETAGDGGGDDSA